MNGLQKLDKKSNIWGSFLFKKILDTLSADQKTFLNSHRTVLNGRRNDGHVVILFFTLFFHILRYSQKLYLLQNGYKKN